VPNEVADFRAFKGCKSAAFYFGIQRRQKKSLYLLQRRLIARRARHSREPDSVAEGTKTNHILSPDRHSLFQHIPPKLDVLSFICMSDRAMQAFPNRRILHCLRMSASSLESSVESLWLLAHAGTYKSMGDSRVGL
jgi:hypothetical protein